MGTLRRDSAEARVATVATSLSTVLGLFVQVLNNAKVVLGGTSLNEFASAILDSGVATIGKSLAKVYTKTLTRSSHGSLLHAWLLFAWSNQRNLRCDD